MHDLGDFSLRDMAECTARVRRLGQGAGSMEEAATRIVTYLYDDFADARSGQRACALVRFYKTHPYGLLDAERRRHAASLLTEEAASPSTLCLTLLATAGDGAGAASASSGHHTIPLPADEGAARLQPARPLVTEIGIDLGAFLGKATPAGGALDSHRVNVFHMDTATESPAAPRDDAFAARHGIHSVLGLGGLLPTGDRFALVFFTKVPIAEAVRELFKTLALAVKVGVMAFAEGPIFSC